MFGLDFIRQLRPCKWRYVGTEDDGVEHMGFIAQDVARLLPPNLYGAVVKGDDGYLRLVMTELIAPLVKAVQELDIETGELRRELAALRGERKGEDGEQRKGQLGDD